MAKQTIANGGRVGQGLSAFGKMDWERKIDDATTVKGSKILPIAANGKVCGKFPIAVIASEAVLKGLKIQRLDDNRLLLAESKAA